MILQDLDRPFRCRQFKVIALTTDLLSRLLFGAQLLLPGLSLASCVLLVSALVSA